jgi:hypothetical protein
VPLGATLPYWPEPPEHLLTPEEPLPPGDTPLLRRVVPGLADGMAQLPPFLRDTALSLRLRTFYFNRLNPDGTQNEAWAFGGWLAYQSGMALGHLRHRDGRLHCSTALCAGQQARHPAAPAAR